MTPLKTIKAKCFECCCGQITEVRECPITDCPLFPFRLGKMSSKRELTDEECKILSERAKRNFHHEKQGGKT